jgi:hypothetical protein
MPIRSDEPLRKVTLNLYEADCQWMEREYGRGWTERLRQHLHNEVLSRQPPRKHLHHRRTLGDLAND